MKKLLCAVMMCLACFTGHVFADGGDERSRPTTAEENAWQKGVLESALAAVPAAPDGWSRRDDKIEDIERIMVTQTNNLWPLRANTSFEKAISQDMNKLAELAGSMGDMQAKIGPLTEKMQAAAEKGDQKEIARLQKELMEIQANDPGLNKMKAMSEEREMGSARVEISINHTGMHFEFVKELPGLAGGAIVFRKDKSTVPAHLDSDSDGITYLLFGPFKKEPIEGGFKAYAERNGSYRQVKTIVIQITARDNKVADDLMARMNTKALAALLN